MYTIDEIRIQIQPVPQKVTALEGANLKIVPSGKVHLTVPADVKGPAKTAVEDMKAYWMSKLGEDCFAEDGIAITLALAEKPEEVKSENEGYRITVGTNGVTIEGFGESGLFYGVISFRQMADWNQYGLELPAVEVLDWPDYPFRGMKEECRYGSNVMEKADWFAMIDDLSSKKFNKACISLYGCWVVQYDGKVAEYLYTPIKDYPQLKTPQTVKYYSPSEGKWYNYETLPPMFRDDFLGEVIVYAKNHGIDVVPGINSFGHNTLFPAQIPAVSPVDEEGNPTKTGFCTSSEETYKLLFSFYDDIIDNYLLPNNITTFNIMLDEVRDQFGANAEMPNKELSAWCKCEKCSKKDRADIFFDHAFKIIRHLKEKGMKSILMANDMFVRESSQMGDNIGKRMLAKVAEYDVADVLVLDWWRYTDLVSTIGFKILPDELNMRSVFAPWNGYYIWSSLTTPLRNIKWQADLMHNSKTAEGLYAYAMWDKSYDLMHDCHTDLCWNHDGAGELEDVVRRYVLRHFAPMADEVEHAYTLLQWMNEDRKEVRDPQNPLGNIISHRLLMTARLSYYNFCYYKPDQPYPRHFPAQALKSLFAYGSRMDSERAIYAISSMAKEALAIFEKAAITPGCDQEMARRMVYEFRNYVTQTEDWIALIKIYDITQKGGDQKKIAPIAKARKEARLALMLCCEQTKEDWVCKAATMRNHSVFMQTFTDIENYINTTDEPQLDLMDITPIMSKENFMVR
ncbi:MAG: family 20 glycosylhydrolase [Oscillospiraceae bacterium]|nr:family 20 glycosylhydrolase [Oscillospiraceae bacterium]